jgi:diacylglycerol kinase family enzyme
MARISVYLNQKAARGNPEQWRDQLFKQLFRHKIEFRTPKSIVELQRYVEIDVDRKMDYIFSIGGDGTANAVIQRMAGHPHTKLLIVPAGTANDFASDLGLEATVKKIVRIFQQKHTRLVDLIKINDRFMFSNGGMGIACDVAEELNHYRSKMIGFSFFLRQASSNIYPLLLLKKLMTDGIKKQKIEIESPDLPGVRKKLESTMILVNNLPVLGGKFTIAPETKNGDGTFNVSLFTHETRRSLAKCAYSILNGQYPHRDPDFQSFETSYLKLSSLERKELQFFGDGETLVKAPILEIENFPNSLEVCTKGPKSDDFHSYSLELIGAL